MADRWPENCPRWFCRGSPRSCCPYGYSCQVGDALAQASSFLLLTHAVASSCWLPRFIAKDVQGLDGFGGRLVNQKYTLTPGSERTRQLTCGSASFGDVFWLNIRPRGEKLALYFR